ncbi:MAG: hypothetical protein ACFFEY_03760 [Candidatus Thorarchaeota archaeon]
MIVDAKLRNLIQVCKETENIKKLAVVSFILTSNLVDSIGIKLGVRPRAKKSQEKIFEYIEMINNVFMKNLKISIFKERQIDTIRESEILFLKNKGEIPINYVKNILYFYYELRKLNIPNLHKNLSFEEYIGSSNMGFYSFLSPNLKRKQNNSDNLKPLILQKIQERQNSIQRDLKRNFNNERLEKVILLQNVKDSIMNERKGKISIEGSLKDNIVYRQSLEKIYGYLFLGIILILISFGSLIAIEILILPLYSGDLSSMALLLFGGAIMLIYIYYKQFGKERK